MDFVKGGAAAHTVWKKALAGGAALATIAGLCLPVYAFAAPQDPSIPLEKPLPVPDANDSEVKLGRENAAEIAKQLKLIKEGPDFERVNRIGKEMGVIANKVIIPAQWGKAQEKAFDYTFHVVDDKDVNAFSLPGGFIYVNKGLIDSVRSDDELAGVLAHEVAHAAHHHMMKLLREQSKIDRALLPLKLLALGLIVSNRANAADAGNLLLGTQLYTVARVNSYGVEAEKDADHMGIELMVRSKYNPVGLYSFMIRLARLEQGQLKGRELGIYRTHPPGDERVAAARAELAQRNIPVALSKVDPSMGVQVRPVKDLPAAGLVEVVSKEIVICRLAAQDGVSAEERGQRAAVQLVKMLDEGVLPLAVRSDPAKTRVVIRGFTLLTQADATAQGKTVDALLDEVRTAITRINTRRQLDTGIF